ncbi:dihydrofolate reductase family protein [Synechococcus sp. PCC 7336]|uniref:dihydrofolate reductase family protein n=1 Tax=Synechococcus sp. PCC 7336 TaxID=195250 RepID=UPI0003488344|nr:dihydrofolate reductase family protein [Synechococcus sp. PCC 7336]
MKATVYIATSVDGFIARQNGSVDWLPNGGDAQGGEDYGYREFIDSVDAIVNGGKTIQRFLSEGLIQQFIITKIPILIGTGIPLFGPLPRDVRLRHLETRQFRNGLVQSKYEVLGNLA